MQVKYSIYIQYLIRRGHFYSSEALIDDHKERGGKGQARRLIDLVPTFCIEQSCSSSMTRLLASLVAEVRTPQTNGVMTSMTRGAKDGLR